VDRLWLTTGARAAFAALAVIGTAAPKGGYFPTSWGWIALGLGAAAVLVLALDRETAIAPLEVGGVALLGMFVCFVALSAVWSQSLPATILQVERDVVYPLGLLAALLVVAGGGVRGLLGGTLAGIVVICAYALGTRLLPERIGTFDPLAGYRLSVPLGYWNALGAFAALGVILALVVAAHARLLVSRIVAASSLPVLLPTLYFTFSRGAWIALGFGAALALALDPRRLRLVTSSLVVLAPAAAAVWLASRSPALTGLTPTFARAEHDGHRLLVEVVLLGICSGAAAFAVTAGDRFLPLDRRLRRAWALVLVTALVVAITVGLVNYGGPVEVVQRGYRSFTGPPITVGQSQSETARLFTLSNNGRIVLWRAALREYAGHPLLGTGAGTFEEYWLQHRQNAYKVKNAHSLYLETLAETGPIGLALLIAALVIPLAAAVRARAHPLVPGAAGAYGVYLLHAAGDWDWQIVGLTTAALLCAAALLRAARRRRRFALSPARRTVLAAVVLTLVAFGVVAEIGNSALAAAAHAASTSQWRTEESQARRASDWAPWSSEALRRLAEAQYSLGQLVDARRTLRQAIAKDPRDWQLWLDLAVVERGRARRKALLQALQLNRHSPEIAGELPVLGLGGSIRAG
jgi:O-Antigen ligase/Tetratricopeptide repeat